MSTEITCAYCGKNMVEWPVPGAWDDNGWEHEATRHDSRCEWVETRAHTRPSQDELAADEKEANQ